MTRIEESLEALQMDGTTRVDKSFLESVRYKVRHPLCYCTLIAKCYMHHIIVICNSVTVAHGAI
jgi:hypothetical protein